MTCNYFSKKMAVVLIAVLMVSMILSLIGTGKKVNAATTLSVDTSNVIQNNFLGVNGVHNGSVYMDAQTLNGMTPANRTILYDRLVKMNVKMVRTQYHPWFTVRGNWNLTYDWNSVEMTQFYSWVQDMKDRNIDVAISLGYYFPVETYNWISGITEDVSNNLNKISDWVSQSVYQLITVRGFTNVKYGLLFTEPNIGGHNEAGGPPVGYTNWTYYKAVVQAIHDKLVADGRRSLIKLVGPNNQSGGAYITEAALELNGVIDIYSGHDYNKVGYTDWYNMANTMKTNVASTGKPFWIDEYGNFSRAIADYGNYIAQAASAFINAGAQTSLIWQISEDWYERACFSGCDNFFMDWGSGRYIPTNSTPYPSWYALGIMSKYMGGPGTQVFSTTNGVGVYISATKPTANDWSFLVTNGNSTAEDITINFSGALNKTLYRYVYDPATISPNSSATMITSDQTFANVGTSLSNSIPSRAVVIYSTLGTNLAIGAVASALTTHTANGYDASKINDGVATTGWDGWANTGSTPDWVQLDLGAARTFNRVELYTTTGYEIQNYQIQYWNGTSWLDAVAITGNTLNHRTHRFAAITGSKIRVYGTSGPAIQPGFVRVNELQVYNDANLAIGAVASALTTDTANGYDAAKINDGVATTDFNGWANTGSVPNWVQLDFGGDRIFNRAVLYTTTGYEIQNYQIQNWNGTSWLDAAAITGNTLNLRTHTFAAITGSKIRVYGTSGPAIQPGYIRVNELQVYND